MGIDKGKFNINGRSKILKPIKSLIAVVLAGIFAMGCSSASETDSHSETAKTNASSTASNGSNSAETQTANQTGANAETESGR